MRCYVAPLEGITDHVYRGVHHAFFPGADKYYTPFFSPTADGHFRRGKWKDALPQNNVGVPLVPQLLTRSPDDFLWAARVMAEEGYGEVNWNLGCPSGTVVAKSKGAAMLAHPEELDRALEAVFSQAPVAVSVKTRLGLKSPDEFPKLLEVFNRYPIHELTVHCRVREDFYKKPAQTALFPAILAHSRNPVCYNGDLLTLPQISAFTAAHPTAPAVMLGRGVIADPALIQRFQGGPAADRDTLHRFDDALYEGYCAAFGNRRNALCRMKEMWFYHICLFEGGEKLCKAIKKTTRPEEYQDLVARIFDTLPLRENAVPTW